MVRAEFPTKKQEVAHHKHNAVMFDNQARDQCDIRMPGVLYLFLDFDGVLHPEGVGAELEFCHLQGFEDLMRRCPQVRIVLSTSWRTQLPFEKLLAIFSADLQSRIVGATPHLQALQSKQGHRQRECEQWLASNAPGASWLAVDDRASYFDADCPQLVLLPHIHDGGTGLEGDALATLQRRIDQELEHLAKS